MHTDAEVRYRPVAAGHRGTRQRLLSRDNGPLSVTGWIPDNCQNPQFNMILPSVGLTLFVITANPEPEWVGTTPFWH